MGWGDLFVMNLMSRLNNHRGSSPISWIEEEEPVARLNYPSFCGSKIAIDCFPCTLEELIDEGRDIFPASCQGIYASNAAEFSFSVKICTESSGTRPGYDEGRKNKG